MNKKERMEKIQGRDLYDVSYVEELLLKIKIYKILVVMFCLMIVGLSGIFFSSIKECKTCGKKISQKWNTDWSVAELKTVTSVRPLYLAMYAERD